MSQKRIHISSDCYLLFAELFHYCETSNSKEEDFQTKLKSLSDKVTKKAPTKQGDYLKVLASKFHRPSTKENTIHGTIITKIKKEKKKSLSPNMNSSLQTFFEKIRKAYPKETKHGLRFFLENTLGSYFPKETEKPLVRKESSNRNLSTNDYSNTIWYFYYHEYLDKPKTPYSVISRLILHIKNFNEIKLYERNEREDFVGAAEPLSEDTNTSTSATLIIHLQRESTPFKKKLELRIIQSGGISDTSVLLGQYMDFETGDKIVSGTFVLENVNGHALDTSTPNPYLANSKYNIIREIVDLKIGNPLKVIQSDLVYYSGWERYIPKEIAKYLSHKWKNHSKTKPVASTLKELGDWLKEQKDLKLYEEFKFNTSIEYDFFIITPVGNIKDISEKEYYKQINKYFFETPNPTDSEITKSEAVNPIYDSINSLKKIGVNRIYYSPRVLKLKNRSFAGEEESHTIIDNDLKAMRKSRFVIFIMPEQVHTSALIKIGWAMQQEKPIIVFPLKKNVLPKLLSKPYEKKIWVTDPMNIKDIPEKLITNYKKVLKW